MKYLILNGFTKNENTKYYDYIMKETYKLSFIKNIDLEIEIELKRIMKQIKYINHI